MNGTQTSHNLESKTDLIAVKESNKVLTIFGLLTSGLLLSFIAILVLVVTNYNLAKKEKIYVEQLNGQTKVARAKDYDFRSEQAIRETVTKWLYLMWEWDSRIADSEELDPGFNVGNRQKVPTKVYAASYLIVDGLRQEILKGMANVIPDSVYDGRLTSNLTIYHIGKPVRKEKDLYEVYVIASRTDISNRGEEGSTKFNKIITLKTIEPYQLVMGADEPSAFRKQLNNLLQSGLIVIGIENSR